MNGCWIILFAIWVNVWNCHGKVPSSANFLSSSGLLICFELARFPIEKKILESSEKFFFAAEFRRKLMRVASYQRVAGSFTVCSIKLWMQALDSSLASVLIARGHTVFFLSSWYKKVNSSRESPTGKSRIRKWETSEGHKFRTREWDITLRFRGHLLSEMYSDAISSPRRLSV